MSASPARLYVPSLPAPGEPCFCGSGRTLSDCCASSAADRPPPTHLRVVHDFLPAAERNALLRYAAKQKRKWLMTLDEKRSTGGKSVQMRDPRRVTQAVDMTKRDPQLQAMFRKALIEQVAPVYQVRPALFEPPYILRYPPGGKYSTHADGEGYDEAARRWYRLRDRDVSLLIYLNDNYQGGGLKFDKLNYTYQPQAGDLVFFPSNHFFSHQSLPIETGIKWAIVSWAAFADSPRVTTQMANWRVLPV